MLERESGLGAERADRYKLIVFAERSQEVGLKQEDRGFQALAAKSKMESGEHDVAHSPDNPNSSIVPLGRQRCHSEYLRAWCRC